MHRRTVIDHVEQTLVYRRPGSLLRLLWDGTPLRS